MSGAARRTLEIAAGSLASALTAQDAGADRVELCEGLASGGTTPSYGTLALAREQLRIPLFVLVRPRSGDFVYDGRECEVMLRDIALCVRLGCDGVVLGALDEEGGIDMALCRELIAAAGPLAVTFHRAFDAVRDQGQAHALEQVIALGCQRVLTSGGCATAPAGAERLAGLVGQAAGRLAVMPGAGIDEHNITTLAHATGAFEFHASARVLRSSAMRYRNPQLVGLEPDWHETSSARVAAMRRALDALSAV